MPVINLREKDKAEDNIQKAITHYRHSDKRSIRGSAEKYEIPYSKLLGRLQGRVSRPAGHLKMLVLTDYEENAIVRWCERLDECGHPA